VGEGFVKPGLMLENFWVATESRAGAMLCDPNDQRTRGSASIRILEDLIFKPDELAVGLMLP
jgi:hypothetical protein